MEKILKQLRAEDRRTRKAPSWENLARRALAWSRALTLVALGEEMLAAKMSEDQAVAILLAAEKGCNLQTADIRRAIDLRERDCRKSDPHHRAHAACVKRNKLLGIDLRDTAATLFDVLHSWNKVAVKQKTSAAQLVKKAR